MSQSDGDVNVGSNWISGSETDDNLTGTAGNDEIHAPFGTNRIDGGDGHDTMVIYQGTSADFTIAMTADGYVIVEGPGLNGTLVRHELTNVERILFNDTTIDTSSLSATLPALIPTSDSSSSDSSSSDSSSTDDDGNSGSSDDSFIAVTTESGSVTATSGNNEIYAPIGSHEIDGGDGEDALVVYEGELADYMVRRTQDGKIYLEGPGLNGMTVRNLLSSVERIVFNDQVLDTSNIETLVGDDFSFDS